MERFRAFLLRNAIIMDFMQKVIAALASIVIAIFVYVAASDYYQRQLRGQETIARLTRTLQFLTSTTGPEDEAQRQAMFRLFPDRWEIKITEPLPAVRAQAYFDTCRKPWEDEKLCHEWDVARRHLNQLEVQAFAYVHDLADSEILAATTCVYMARSYQYFRELIAVFRTQYGAGQSWQVIPQAVELMQSRYGTECANLQHELDAKRPVPNAVRP
jgi:hypothetical protein